MSDTAICQDFEQVDDKMMLAESVVAAVTRVVGFAAMLFAAVFVLLMWAQPVWADDAMQRGDLVRILTDRYAESPAAMGLTGDGRLLEVLTTQDGKTWTIILTKPDGTSQVISAGQAWTQTAVALGPDV